MLKALTVIRVLTGFQIKEIKKFPRFPDEKCPLAVESVRLREDFFDDFMGKQADEIKI